MFTVFDESEIDTLAKKSEYKKIKVSLREDGRLSSYVKVSLSVSQSVMMKILFSGWVQSRRLSHNRDCGDMFGQAKVSGSHSDIQEEHEQRRHQKDPR